MFSHIFKHENKIVPSEQSTQYSAFSETQDELNKGHVFEEKAAQPMDAKQTTNAPVNHDARNAMWYYLRAALRGDKEAQYKMGLSYLNGQLGLDRSYFHAEKWLDQAADQGHTQAKFELQDALNRLAFS